ncbi:phage holin family protein [Clostridium mediterraneense]|uniref:phage holin family protein n=1 Tax=Clostridium mediterraneense TaxID=1805472 RepID=UPI0008338B38|nr:phage holin family protein [Clostridium mediterraneense]
MEDLTNFIPHQLLILVAALYVIGTILKKTPKVQDWMIPWILLVIGIIFSVIICGFSATSILQGIICSFGSVGINQLYKQTVSKR